MKIKDAYQRLVRSISLSPSARGTGELEKVKQLGEDLKHSAVEVRRKHNEMRELYRIVSDMAHAAGGMIWRKDARLRYEFGNSMLCRRFLMPDRCHEDMTHEDCTGQIRGFTTQDLIDAYITRTRSTHTFADVAEVTDNYVLRTLKQCQFYEFGVIDDRAVALYITKTPLIDHDTQRLIGLVGFAFDETQKCTELLERARTLEKVGEATQLADGVFMLSEGQKVCSPAELGAAIEYNQPVMQ